MPETKKTEGEQPELETEETVVEAEAENNELTALQEQMNALNDKYVRMLAEYDNFRKRSAKEKSDIYPRATADTVEKFLPIIDNFERAMSAPCADETFKKGMDMIFQAFMNTLTSLNVEVIGKAGETFDPNLHNAVMHIEDEQYGDNEIVQVLQKGYRIGDRVVRYAMVQVAN